MSDSSVILNCGEGRKKKITELFVSNFVVLGT